MPFAKPAGLYTDLILLVDFNTLGNMFGETGAMDEYESYAVKSVRSVPIGRKRGSNRDLS